MVGQRVFPFCICFMNVLFPFFTIRKKSTLGEKQKVPDKDLKLTLSPGKVSNVRRPKYIKSMWKNTNNNNNIWRRH